MPYVGWVYLISTLPSKNEIWNIWQDTYLSIYLYILFFSEFYLSLNLNVARHCFMWGFLKNRVWPPVYNWADIQSSVFVLRVMLWSEPDRPLHSSFPCSSRFTLKFFLIKASVSYFALQAHRIASIWSPNECHCPYVQNVCRHSLM